MVERVLRNIGTLFRELDKAFKHELPPRLEGASAGEIAKLCGRRLDRLRDRLVKAFQG
jgi:DNA-directed RNA polymerase specialized sigma24 family protein